MRRDFEGKSTGFLQLLLQNTELFGFGVFGRRLQRVLLAGTGTIVVVPVLLLLVVLLATLTSGMGL